MGWSTRASVFVGLVLGLFLATALQWLTDDHAQHSTKPVLLLERRTLAPAEDAQPHPRGRAPKHRHGKRRRRRSERVDDDPTASEPPTALSPTPLPPSPSWGPRLCPLNCSGRGVCNEDTGRCLCPMGRDGPGCERPDPFPCNLPHGEQLVGRCSGQCDLDESRCYCGGGKFPRRSMAKCVFRDINPYMRWDGPGWDYETVVESPTAFWSSVTDAPAYLRGHKAWSDPARQRRPGHVAWCDAEVGEAPSITCRCQEGTTGHLCQHVVLHACLNQCNGRGTCSFGFCRCDPGWYGVDCSIRNGRITLLEPGHAGTLALAAPSGGSACGRAKPPNTPYPAIYIYELPIEFNLRLWTEKYRDEDCALRSYTQTNSTDWKQHAFGMEVALYERLLHSAHRVLDPETADFFFVPVWGGCWMSRFSRPTPRHHDLGSMIHEDPEVRLPRAARASGVYRKAFEHIRTTYPYWDRSGGADHIFTFPHDEGACLAPKEITAAIFVSHWGRLTRHPPNHTSTSAGHGWHVSPFKEQMYGHERCFEPGKDVLLPIFKSRGFVQASPYLTGKLTPRNVLLNFRGNAHVNQPAYSFGLRQQLYSYVNGHPDQCKCADPGHMKNFKNACPPGGDKDGCLLVGGHSRDYIADLQRSIFCVVLPGNGWGHIEEPVIHGCIPVIIMPDIHVQLEGVLNMSAFSVRIPRADLPRIVKILQAIPPATIQAMQAEMAKIWERFTYSGLFKRELQLQLLPPDALTKSRVGAPPDDQRAKVFTKLEGRLRGLDAPDGFVAHLRNRLVLHEQHCAVRPAADAAKGPWPPVPLVAHGPPVPPNPPVDMFVWTHGVV